MVITRPAMNATDPIRSIRRSRYPVQVQDFKSNTKGICFSEDWPEELNYHYISFEIVKQID